MPHSYNVVLPDRDDFYLIREDQLDSIKTGGKDHSLDIALAAGGGSLGFLQNVMHVWRAFQNSSPMEPSDFYLAILCIILIVLTVLKLIEWRKTRSSVDTIFERIKSGQKVPVGRQHG
jgi:hypothetical protein